MYNASLCMRVDMYERSRTCKYVCDVVWLGFVVETVFVAARVAGRESRVRRDI